MLSSSPRLLGCNMTQSNPTDCRKYTEKRIYNHRRKNYMCDCVQKYILIFTSLSIYMTGLTSAQATSCDFTGSGLDMDGSSVQPVYLSCAAGRVEWNYPRAALRITFRYPHAKGEFRGCIRVKDYSSFEGARLFVEGHRSLLPLYPTEDERPLELPRCFTSHKGRVSLFLEAVPLESFTKLTVSFEYDLRPLRKGEIIYDPLEEECRPCSDSELVQNFCSSDFAAKGYITGVTNELEMDRTAISFLPTKVFTQTNPVFTEALNPKKRNFSPNEYLVSEKDLSLLSNHNFGVLWSNDKSEELRGKLHVPLLCGSKAAPGEFLFLGTLRLGEPIHRCSTSIANWQRVVKNAKDNAHCVLHT